VNLIQCVRTNIRLSPHNPISPIRCQSSFRPGNSNKLSHRSSVLLTTQRRRVVQTMVRGLSCLQKNVLFHHQRYYCKAHRLSSSVRTMASTTTTATDNTNNKRPKVGLFDKKDTVHFDPTSIGLPKNWSLTDWSDLKG